jgi:hypothetical protein
MVNQSQQSALKNLIRVLRKDMILAARFTAVTKTRKHLHKRFSVLLAVHLAENERVFFF